jgi:hypothetical protein
VIGLENALALLTTHLVARRSVFAAIDAPHAAYSTASLPSGIGQCDLWRSNEDITLGENAFISSARAALDRADHPGAVIRPWDDFVDFVAMRRDPELSEVLE